MEEDVIGIITQAEARAAEIKAKAQAEAAEIIAGAEKKAAEIVKSSELSCAEYRREALAEAEKTAQSDYEKSIADSCAEAKNYADSLIKYSGEYVSGIVGRLVK